MKRLQALGVCALWMTAWWMLFPRLGPQVKAWALARMGRTADYFFTYLGPELAVFVFGLVVLPLLYLLLLRHLPLLLQGIVTPLLVLAATIGAYWDVYQIAREAEHLCTTEAGLKVYRRVEAEGFLGDSDIAYWNKRGFEWTEHLDSTGTVFKHTLVDGIPNVQRRDRVESRFEYRLPERRAISANLEESRQRVVDRLDGQILGEIVSIHIFRGQLDRFVDFGLHFSPPTCWEDKPHERGGRRFSGPRELILAVIEPSHRNSER
ncbi:MAG: hypothetical protein AB7O21_17765 [Gammaproteobacteria bacterium]